jgi:hypothetical protein
MNKFLSVFSASVLSFTILAGLAGNAYAKSQLTDEVEEFGFSDSNKVSGDELAGMRGGLRIGALNFDFAITSRTLVDGVLQHTSTITSSILEKNNALKDSMPTAQKLAASIVPVSITPNTNGSNDNSTPVNVTTDNETGPPDNSSGDGQSLTQTINLSTGIGVIMNNETLATTIQNSNDNAVIQQFNQMDITVSNLSEMQKLNIAQQLDFQSINSIR